MSKLVAPHGGGALRPLRFEPPQWRQAVESALRLKAIRIGSREVSDLLMLGMGAYTPLDGFMGHDDWAGVCRDMRLASGVFWPIPITLSQAEDVANGLAIGDEVVLIDDETGHVVGVLRVSEKYRIDKADECRAVFRTTDPAHPGVAKVLAQGEVNIAGPVVALSEGEYPEKFPNLYLRPEEARAAFTARGWTTVAAFQTRNPMHRSHEHLVKMAAEVCDGVFVHQVLGKLKDGDIPAEVRSRAVQALIDGYFAPEVVMQAGYPIEMRYAGPREALLHAVIRQNFGCSHLIVGRDHAGVGNYYGPFEAQKIFDELWDGAMQCEALKFDVTFYCRRCAGMATGTTCPHGPEDHLSISGTEQRRLLAAGDDIPAEFSRPEVVKILRAYYQGLAR